MIELLALSFLYTRKKVEKSSLYRLRLILNFLYNYKPLFGKIF